MVDLRSFLSELDQSKELLRIGEPLSKKYEIPSILQNFDADLAVLFEKVEGHNVPIVGGICATRNRICKALKIDDTILYPHLLAAIRNPLRSKICDDGPVKEVQEKPMLSKIKFFFEQSWLLIVASFCFGLLIAGTNYALSARIERNRTAKLYSRTGDLLNSFNAMIAAQLPKAEAFEEFAEIEILSPHGKSHTVKVIRALSADEQTVVGWSFNAAGSGFAGD